PSAQEDTGVLQILAPPESECPSERRWGGLRQQWKLLGLFEIDQKHEFYSLTCMMKEGLAAAIQTTVDNPPTKDLSEEDFRSEVTQVHKEFTLETFAGPVFANLRGSLGITEEEYQQSLCSESCYLQFISNSKSKADFFLTQEHYTLKASFSVFSSQKYFMVMQSVFYPDDRINARYDIKGCEVSRWTEPAPEGSQIIVVLKDLNFEGQFISLGEDRSWLIQQVEIDTNFLQRLNVLDYSLLLAHQPLHQDERNQSLSFASLIVRTKKSHVGSGADTPEIPDFKAQNRRLLPNLKNPLHIIDGPEQRYFIGIIDIFTVYSFKKRLEHLWKSLRHPGRSFSTVNPQTYCLRLCQWVQDHAK
uniref:Phosphatidylinositol-4-phosphate 5-kinase-like 1 n=1 Tax=Cyprinodon variegatus TaxID=28743 RepID=A0A3Q2DJ10_CYPVA